LKIEVVVGGLDTAWAIDFAPDGRIFITERPGVSVSSRADSCALSHG